MILIKQASIYAPAFQGVQDVLLGGETILLMGETIELNHPDVMVIDGAGKRLVPGLIDQHVHITGGGGEGSFKTRVPEITLSKLVEAGITTVVGLLGTDASTRSVENLVAKAKALKEEGITAYAHTGSYEYPSVTLTGSVRKDIVFIEEIIGGKVALSDHRSSSLTPAELARLASDVRTAGMLSGKAGALIAHMGSGRRGMGMIREVLENTDIPITTIRPTHVNRAENLLQESLLFAKDGGIIDITCGTYQEWPAHRVIQMAREQQVPLENITISSDGYGSWSTYDEKGVMLKIGVSQVSSFWESLRHMVMEETFTLEEALPFFTSHVAKALCLQQKGRVAVGADADLLLVNSEMELESVIARGRLMMHEGNCLVKGTYEV
ncbi:beta-aspartyl-peptidase [Anoxynatronum buryatiense]|uniref:Isoaspartyl dipeptidase n=1 Tax=Anoxynatronum buryatiense TaxID=489973 RepID=A0AA45WV12_9CLOT|nr:beta-aspartyl-peptidase [Anoxynatronum buryatiense]SMP51347.1 isoaspartyl dipeptidase. Metallo peptidase. MEROPS family M38 [Anoxynatronum buryatiense]